MNSNTVLLRPTIKLKAKNPQFAIFGHFLSMISGSIGVILGLGAFDKSIWGALFSIFGGIFIIIVEIDYFSIPQLKDAMTRGIVWIIIGILTVSANPLITLFFAVSGVMYILYTNQ